MLRGGWSVRVRVRVCVWGDVLALETSVAVELVAPVIVAPYDVIVWRVGDYMSF